MLWASHFAQDSSIRCPTRVSRKTDMSKVAHRGQVIAVPLRLPCTDEQLPSTTYRKDASAAHRGAIVPAARPVVRQQTRGWRCLRLTNAIARWQHLALEIAEVSTAREKAQVHREVGWRLLLTRSIAPNSEKMSCPVRSKNQAVSDHRARVLHRQSSVATLKEAARLSLASRGAIKRTLGH